eukprot:TRINITY_DN45224_c0_g1_i1.p1 TRINITY_DN45224_c0_g1~~TRINITY_DN45224_c0_g1_i1.p1  ORF type:complete len:141 (+),score=31.69 TRINITY_DN45224_c0_g1_i1:144-566(+)
MCIRDRTTSHSGSFGSKVPQLRKQGSGGNNNNSRAAMRQRRAPVMSIMPSPPLTHSDNPNIINNNDEDDDDNHHRIHQESDGDVFGRRSLFGAIPSPGADESLNHNHHQYNNHNNTEVENEGGEVDNSSPHHGTSPFHLA